MTTSITQLSELLIIGFPQNVMNIFPWDKHSFQVERYSLLITEHDISGGGGGGGNKHSSGEQKFVDTGSFPGGVNVHGGPYCDTQLPY